MMHTSDNSICIYKYNTTDYILIQGFLFVVASASSCGVSSMTFVTSPMAFICPSRSSVVNVTINTTSAAHCSYLNPFTVGFLRDFELI